MAHITPIIQIFTEQFLYTHNSILLNIENIGNEESIIAPATGGNCMNWIVGHVIDARNQLLLILNGQPVWDNQTKACYARGSNPNEVVNEFMLFEDLIENLKLSNTRLIEAIKILTAEELDRKFIVDFKTQTIEHSILEWLTVFSFHEGYHTGQTGLLRRVLGKEGQIK